MLEEDKQKEFYDDMMSSRRPTRGLSCGYDSRFDPFLLDSRPDLVPEFEKLLGAAFPRRAELLLDIGCGSGLYFPLLAGMAEHVIGIDTSEEMIKAAQRLVDKKELDNVDARVANAEELPFPDRHFDAVLGFDVLHHIPDFKRAMAEVRRVLRPGGRFASIEPNVLNPVVWLAHALPPEERNALRRNYPWVIRRLVRNHIGPPSSRYLNHVTGTNSRIIKAGLSSMDAVMRFRPLSYFSIRMLWTAEKR